MLGWVWHYFLFQLYKVNMSFGRPPNIESSPGKAPLLGSFPLDHDGSYHIKVIFYSKWHSLIQMSLYKGECKTFMKDYVKCLRENKNNNGLCRQFSQAYLQCRMDK